MKTKHRDIITGVAWYKRDQWDQLLSVSTDRDTLEKTYDEWITGAQASYKQIEQMGLELQKIEVDINELIQWCQQNCLNIDSSARTSFVLEKIQKQKRK